MSQARDSVTSIVITVTFLVLTAIATLLYGGTAEQRTQLDNNWFWQKTRVAMDTGLAALESLGGLGTGSSSPAAVSETAVVPEPSFWSKVGASFQDAWQKSGGAATSSPELTTSQPADNQPLAAADNSSSFNWVKTANGAEIVFKAKSGHEYKLPLPFKFLSK
jgi:hypothetical protein